MSGMPGHVFMAAASRGLAHHPDELITAQGSYDAVICPSSLSVGLLFQTHTRCNSAYHQTTEEAVFAAKLCHVPFSWAPLSLRAQ